MTSNSVTVATAERAGGDRPSQDRIFTTDRAVIVLDGASRPVPSTRDGGWIADQIGTRIQATLTSKPNVDLQVATSEAIAGVVHDYHLEPGDTPTTTVSIARWGDDVVDVLVLGDSPVIMIDRADTTHEIRDDRLDDVNTRLGRPTGFLANSSTWHQFLARQSRQRNTDGGFWIAGADPEAADHAITASWPVAQLVAVLVLTDGAARGVDNYRHPPTWLDAYLLATRDPNTLVDAVHAAELTDPHGHRWPRSKRHDDKAIALIQFPGGG